MTVAATAADPVYLHPGQMIVTSDPTVVTTILGSCVAVCLWDAQARIAGVNHFLLPRNPLPGTDDPRYGDTAVDSLIAAIAKRGAALNQIVAKIFGGATVLADAGASLRSIGAQNAAIARQALDARGVVIATDQTGGQRGRKLLFDAATGSAYVKEL